MRHFLVCIFLLIGVVAHGYEFVLEDHLTRMLVPSPKEVLDFRSLPSAVVHVITDIEGMTNCGKFCTTQEKTTDGYYFYVVANEFVDLDLSAPQFFPKTVVFEERLGQNEVRQLKITRTGKNPSGFHINWNNPDAFRFSCEEDVINLASSLYRPRRGAPQVWVYTDLPFSEINPMFDSDMCELISSPNAAPYRLVIKQKNVEEDVPFEKIFSNKVLKKNDILFLKEDSPMKFGDGLEPFTTYRLDISW